MRLFLAIDLPESVKKDLHEKLQHLQDEYPYFRWTPEQNYHITVYFFGEIAKPDKVIKHIEESLFDIPQLYLYSSNVDLFMKSKIILHLTFRREKNLEKIGERLNKDFQHSLNPRFLAHLTFARYRIPSKQQYLLIKKKLSNLRLDIEFPVKKLYLFNSIQYQGKSVYKKVATFNLYKDS